MGYRKGPSTYDVRKILVFFDPLPPCPHLGLIYSTKFTQRVRVRQLPRNEEKIGSQSVSLMKPCWNGAV